MNVTKKILRTLLLTLLTSVCSAQEPKADVEAPARKMDVLFIAIDDMNDWTTVFDKNNPIQTPNLERLAARGAFFEKAYCASPSCNPSRTATLTGLRPTTSGVYNNPDPWGEMLPDVITLPQVFKHDGYAAIGAGKIFTHGKAGVDRKGNPSFDAFYKLQSAGKSKLNADKPHMNYNGYPDRKYLDWGEHDTVKQADEHTVEYVNEAMASHPREKPLFLAAGIYRPHIPFFAPPRTFERYPLNTLCMPPMPENDLADVPPLGVEMARVSLHTWDYTSQKPDHHPGSLKKMVQSYQAASDFADEMVGRLLDQLDKTGRAENTIIVLWSDHGHHLGDKTSCGKTTLWEKANRVPFIIVAPGITKPETRIDTPVSLVDIYPTLLDLAGLPAKPDVDGQSLVPLLKDPQAKWDRPALMTQGRGNHAVRSRDWRYIRYKDGTEELYDCKTDDPWNHTNLLAGENKDNYTAVVAEHKKWLPATEAPESPVPPPSKKQAAASVVTDGSGNAVVAQRSEDGFIPLFDGKTFRGWYAADMSWWFIQDGAITGTITKEKPCKKNQYLFYEPHMLGDKDLPLYDSRGVMANFELKLTHRILSSHKVNGGFQYRSEHYEDGDCKGYQIDNNTKTPWLARMYDEFGRHTLAWRGERTRFDESGKRHVSRIETVPAKAHFALEEWHTYHLVCRGTHMTLSIDGEMVAEVFDEQPSAADLSGLFAPQLHSGPPMVVQFKDILYKPLPSTGPMPSPAASKRASTDKTLVSWVTLADKEVRAGSILTVQNSGGFDGIVWAERDAGKWMAGSNFYRRTEKHPGKNPKESADNSTQVQIAIVYTGNQISIYRNGELYTSYEAQNVDLLSGKDCAAVFGLRHTGGTSSIAGAIDDARIYGKALTAEDLKALKPNQPSAIQPVAWWDFEGDEIVDRAGRFSHHIVDGGAKLEDGKLVLKKNSALVVATTEAGAKISRRSGGQPVFTGPYVPETPAWPEHPPATWLTYHLAHPGPGTAVPGDPNPAFYYKGRYHLHYIYKDREARKKEKGRDLGPDWAHVSSEDMVHWTWHPTVLGPKTMGHGMFSGTGFFTKEGKPGIIYHGKSSNRNWISYAMDDKLEQWSKPELVLPKDKEGKDVTEMPYFDPDIWINNGIYYGLNGVSSKKPAVLMKSDNLKDWDYIGELLHPDFDEEKLGVARDEDISCANIFKLGDPSTELGTSKWVLLCISHDLGCRYFIGDFKDEQFLPEQHGMMNWAAWDFFAPESLLTPDGRRVMWAWCTTIVSKRKKTTPRKNNASLPKKRLQTGIQSLPRELSLSEDGKLVIKPLRELEKLRGEEKRVQDLTVQSDTTHVLEEISGDTMELEVVLDAPSVREFGIKVLADQRGKEGFTTSSGKGSKTLNVGYINPPFELKEGEDLTLRIFIDKNLIEVFANDRQAAVGWHDYDAKDLHVSLFSKGGDLRVKRISAWQMNSIYPKEATELKENTQ